ncbi:MAG: hypothetical protein NTV65_11500 [Proteobacteria bacterium]|nr:hypothetical protein [Pseudomonadota bacterium]
MYNELSSYSDLTTLSLIFTGALMAAGIAIVFRRFMLSCFAYISNLLHGNKRSAAQLAIAEFQSKFWMLREKMHSLDLYATEYHNTYNDNGYGTLVTMVNELTYAEKVLETLMLSRRYSSVCNLSEMLLGTLPTEQQQLCVEQFAELAHLANWQDESRQLLVNLIHIAIKSAQTTHELGISRKHAKQPILTTLAEILHSLES